MEEFPDEVWDAANWPTDPAERQAFKTATFLARWHTPNGFQQVPKGASSRLFTKPEWQTVKFDLSNAGDGTELRTVAHKGSAVGAMLHGGQRMGRRLLMTAISSFESGLRPAGMPTFGAARRTKVSAAIRSALEHWVSAK